MTEVQLTWVATAHYRRLATVAMLPLLAAVVLGGPGYLVLAAPMLAALALAARRPGFGVRIRVQLSADRCVEGEEITIRVRAEPGGPAGSLGARLSLPPALLTAGPVACAQGGTGVLDTEWRGTAQRWGRWNGQIVITATSRGGLFTGTAAVSIPQITVFPRPPSLAQLVLPADLRTRIGDHVNRRTGEGVEFAGIRPFAAGDRLRRINWPVTSRRGALHVNQLAAERAAEIVTVIDAFTDTGPPGNSTLDRTVRGAAGIARAYTRAGDRVGVITLDAPLRWISPGTGSVQFFHIAESVLDARGTQSYVPPDLTRIPRTAHRLERWWSCSLPCWTSGPLAPRSICVTAATRSSSSTCSPPALSRLEGRPQAPWRCGYGSWNARHCATGSSPWVYRSLAGRVNRGRRQQPEMTGRRPCDTRSHVASELAGWRADDVGGIASGQCSGSVPALTCVAGNCGVRSSGKKPKRVPFHPGAQARGRPDGRT